MGHKENGSSGNVIGQLEGCTLYHPFAHSCQSYVGFLNYKFKQHTIYFLAITSYQILPTVNGCFLKYIQECLPG
jgi:hypothetical protein